jgi:hypothetical protein
LANKRAGEGFVAAFVAAQQSRKSGDYELHCRIIAQQGRKLCNQRKRSREVFSV